MDLKVRLETGASSTLHADEGRHIIERREPTYSLKVDPCEARWLRIQSSH